LLHYAAGAAATFSEAIHRFVRYSSIVNEGVVVNKKLTTSSSPVACRQPGKGSAITLDLNRIGST
jgi:hypothetical protein